MLAEMDSRLQLLQQELESVAVPIARRGSEQRRPPRRADSDPLAALSAAHEAPADTRVMTPEPPAEHATRPPTAPARAPRAPRPAAPEADAVEERMAEEARTAAELLPTARPRSRRASPVARARPAAPALEDTPRRVPPTLSAPTSTAAPAAPAPPPYAAAARSTASETLVRQTILEAEEEARRVVENARERIVEIGTRTRALLEHSLGATPDPAVEPPPPQPRPARRRRAVTVRTPEQRSYHGDITVEAGPFADVGQLDEFEDALASVPGVEDVYIRTFERYYAHFELSVVQPTALIAELQARVPDSLRIVDAGDHDLRLEIVRDGIGAAGA